MSIFRKNYFKKSSVGRKMSIPLDKFLIKHTCKLRDKLKAKVESGPYCSNGTFYLLLPERSFHYEIVKTGNFELYNEFLEDAEDVWHSEKDFRLLIETFDVDKMGKVKVNVYSHSKNMWVQNGNHRISICAVRQIFGNTMPLEHIEADYFPDIKDLLRESLRKTTGYKNYNGWDNRTEFGYHGFNIHNIDIPGQRTPIKRLEKIKKHYDFKDKVVLDLGCNTGGMLFHIPEIKKGVGIDYDQTCIDSCNFFKEWLFFTCEFAFYKRDLNDFDCIDFCTKENIKPDIIFLLSVGAWVYPFAKLCTDCFKLAKHILLETNNDELGTPNLELFEKLGGKIILVSTKSDDDTTGNYGRKTYLIETNCFPPS